MKIIPCDQGSPEWWEARKGLPTASGFDRIVTSKGLPSKGQDRYIAELIGDTVMQLPTYFTSQGRPITKAMTNGTDCEPEARRYFELLRECTVHQVGFITNDAGTYGCSPDGLIQPDNGLELKCPDLKTHAMYLLKGILPREYKCQVHGCMIVTERPKWTFMSYAHGLEPLIIDVSWDEFTDNLKKSVEQFCLRLADAKIKLLNTKGDSWEG